jgi:hypothetical protein
LIAFKIWKIQLEKSDLSRLTAAKNQPAVQCRCPMLAASARLYPKVRGCLLNHIAQPDLLFGNEAWQAQSMGSVFFLAGRAIVFALISTAWVSISFFCHAICLLVFPASRTW